MKKQFSNFYISAGTIIVFILIMEMLLALFYPSKIKFQPYHEKYDPTLGWVNRPLKNEGVHFEFARSRFFHVTHNSLGLRGPETSYKKPAGIKRVLFVGDSYFWGYGVSDNEVLTQVIQRQVPSSVEILNGGTTGYGTDQMLLWLRYEGLKYNPDIVVFGFTAANDLDEIASSVSYYSPKPIFMLENNEFVLKNVPVPRTSEIDRKTFGSPATIFGKLKKYLRHHTHIYPFIIGRLNSRPALRKFFIDIGVAEEYTTNLGNIKVLKNPPERLWEIAVSLIKESKRITEESGAKFVLVFIPSKEDTSSSPKIESGAKEDARTNNADMAAILEKIASRDKIIYLDLLPSFNERLVNGKVLYNMEEKDHHWNAAGHRFAADEILSFIRKQGWL